MIFNKPSNTEKTSNDSGFTLIEVLIAIAIFAVGFLAVGVMQINALTKTNAARRVTEAMAVADERVEMLRALPFYADDNGINDDGVFGTDLYDIPPDLSGDVADNPHFVNVAGPYTVWWTVQDDFPLDPIPNDVKADAAGNALTRSKTIRVWVTPDNDAGNTQAEITFAKFYGYSF